MAIHKHIDIKTRKSIVESEASTHADTLRNTLTRTSTGTHTPSILCTNSLPHTDAGTYTRMYHHSFKNN